jgi:hypothetical protein
LFPYCPAPQSQACHALLRGGGGIVVHLCFGHNVSLATPYTLVKLGHLLFGEVPAVYML